ncbi:MAG: serine hydrolase domain-containing protein [Planctomycetota bacterium]
MQPAPVAFLLLLGALAHRVDASVPPPASEVLFGIDASPLVEPQKALRKKLDAAFPDEVRATAAVVVDGKTVWSAASGKADGERGRALSPDHLFDLGSLSKHVTAAALLRLVEQGELALDDPLGKHLASFTPSEGAARVRDLLAHTSGLPAASTGTTPAERSAFIAVIAAAQEPRKDADFAYSNLGYQLASALVEEVAEEPFESFVQRELFERARLRSATLVGGKAPKSRLATTRISGTRRSRIEAFPSGWGRKGATGVLMSVHDFARWDQALVDGDVLSDASRGAWSEAGPGGYSLGWFVARHSEYGLRLSHGGSVEGYRSSAARWPDRKVSIVVLGGESVPVEPILRSLEEIVLPGSAMEAEPEADGAAPAGGSNFGFHPGAFAKWKGAWVLESRHAWSFPRLDADQRKGKVHGFLRREIGGAPPVSIYINVEEAAARRWLEEIRSRSSGSRRSNRWCTGFARCPSAHPGRPTHGVFSMRWCRSCGPSRARARRPR